MNFKIAHLVVLLSLIAGSSFADDSKNKEYKPKYGPTATRLLDHNAYVKTHMAPDFWALNSYYVPQETGGSCSVATAVMILNGLRAHQKLSASDELITHTNALAKTSADFWPKAVTKGGHGVDLNQMGEIFTKLFETYGLKNLVAEVIHADGTKEANAKIHAALVANEKSDSDFIAANFLQSEYTGDPEGAIGHLAPVAAYDAQNKKVLIFDPDRTYYEPYWISEETFMKGLSTKDSSSNQARGIVWIKVKK